MYIIGTNPAVNYITYYNYIYTSTNMVENIMLMIIISIMNCITSQSI